MVERGRMCGWRKKMRLENEFDLEMKNLSLEKDEFDLATMKRHLIMQEKRIVSQQNLSMHHLKVNLSNHRHPTTIDPTKKEQ